MMDFNIIIIQIVLNIVIIWYIYSKRQAKQHGHIPSTNKGVNYEMDKLLDLREIKLTRPLSEVTRPSSFSEVIGQEDGIKALKAAICSNNPQNVIIYGPPGVGKTAAARLVLEYAKRCGKTPFKDEAKFVEIDATTVRFDERGIADPLIGTVHDPIYQGAGPMGSSGIPQPKPGAVTKAHGGILFIDEIGELHPIQMNKLLKVLEDRVVYLESAYYNPDDTRVPLYIHDIFAKGLPADFRLIGATTRGPESIPPALRSRCMEIYFRSLNSIEVRKICDNAISKIQFAIEAEAIDMISKYASNGRETVNILQMAMGVCINEGREYIEMQDVEWVVNSSQYSPRMDKKIRTKPLIGVVNGLAVSGNNVGAILEIEASAYKVDRGKGKLRITGIVEEEEIANGNNRKMTRKSMARGSIENVLTALKNCCSIETEDYTIHVNFPGGIPIDGPSAGVTMAIAIYSAIKKILVSNIIAMTGEISINGDIMPVGGVNAKIEAAIIAGATRIIIPNENWQESYKDCKAEIIAVNSIKEVINIVSEAKEKEQKVEIIKPIITEPLSATGV